MAPFPWHFGGQRHQNIFMMPEELLQHAKINSSRICLDMAHLMMTCNHFGVDFQRSLEILLPVTAHLHVADASGVNGEGVVMGAGDVLWPDAWSAIVLNKNVSFIPEVWQGHKDNGTGFWFALDLLKEIPLFSSPKID
jgi:N-acetylneuraminate synthase